MVGIIDVRDAVQMAVDAELDLVEVSPPWDPSGVTGLNGVQMMFEIMCLVAESVGSGEQV